MNHSQHTWLSLGEPSFLTPPQWQVALLKMNQHCLHPGFPWEEDEGANHTFPKYWGVATGAWEPESQGPRLCFLSDSKGLPQPPEQPPGNCQRWFDPGTPARALTEA